MPKLLISRPEREMPGNVRGARGAADFVAKARNLFGNCHLPVYPSQRTDWRGGTIVGEQVYFSVGEAIAILSITLAIPQYVRPVVLFRLRAQQIRLSWLYVAVFVGCLFTIIAVLAPRINWLPDVAKHALVWELLAAFVFIGVFILFSSAFLRPPRVRSGRFRRYVVEAAAFLAHADDKDRAEFARDLLANIGAITRVSAFGGYREELSAFYLFIHRKKLEDAAYAASFLQLIAEQQFCSVLVSRTPWEASEIVA